MNDKNSQYKLDALDRQVRYLRRRVRGTQILIGVLLSLLTVGMAWNYRSQKDSDDIVRAKGLIIHDASGDPRASLSLRDDGPLLELLDSAGHSRVKLGATELGTALQLNDGVSLRLLIGMGSEWNAEPSISFYKNDGKSISWSQPSMLMDLDRIQSRVYAAADRLRNAISATRGTGSVKEKRLLQNKHELEVEIEKAEAIISRLEALAWGLDEIPPISTRVPIPEEAEGILKRLRKEPSSD